MTFRILVFGLIAFLNFCGCNRLMAQNSHLIPTDQVEVDGALVDIRPGDTLLLEGGTRDHLKFLNITGSTEAPVVITMADEKVVINTTAHTGIAFNNCAFVHLTGAGGPEMYGIEIAAAGSMGIYVTEYSTDVEADHMEIHHIGFAGIMAKTDPNCDRMDLRDFVMKNISFHHNYIHDTGGEGFYIGYSWYPRREIECGGSMVSIYPHALQGVRVYDNIIKNTGWDGLQVGSSTADVKIYGNYIENYGLENKEWQNHAVQIGEGTTGDFFNNFIYNGSGGGVSFFGSGNNRLFNNVIAYTGESAIYQNDRGAGVGTKYRIYNNTIIAPKRSGIFIESTKTRNNLVANNIIVLEGAFSGIIGDDHAWTSEGNMFFAKVEEVGFVNPDSNNYRLQEKAKCVDAGYSISFLKFDYDFNSRPANGRIDVGAFEYGGEPYEMPALGAADQDGSGIELYPNPARELVHLKLNGHSHPDSMIIYDRMGRVVSNGPLNLEPGQQDHKIPLSKEWARGIYIISFYEENKHLSTQKILVK